MSSSLLRRRQVFWVYLRDEGKCRRCGKPVSPDEASLIGDAPELPRDLSELRHLKLAHSDCAD